MKTRTLSYLLIINKLQKQMKKFVTLLFIMTCFTTLSEAQTFLEHLQKKEQGKASVKVSQSKDIDELVNGNVKITKIPTQKIQKQKSTEKEHQIIVHPVAPTKQEKTIEHTKEEIHHKHENVVTATEKRQPKEVSANNEMEIPTVDMRKKVMRKSYRVNGYRVQAYAGGNSRADRQRAESIRDKIKQILPNEPIYVHFYSPRWICRVGNYRSYEEAARVLRQIKAMGYRQACIVRGKISVQY